MPYVALILASKETPSDNIVNTNIITNFPWLQASILIANLSWLVRYWRKNTAIYNIIIWYHIILSHIILSYIIISYQDQAATKQCNGTDGVSPSSSSLDKI